MKAVGYFERGLSIIDENALLDLELPDPPPPTRPSRRRMAACCFESWISSPFSPTCQPSRRAMRLSNVRFGLQQMGRYREPLLADWSTSQSCRVRAARGRDGGQGTPAASLIHGSDNPAKPSLPVTAEFFALTATRPLAIIAQQEHALRWLESPSRYRSQRDNSFRLERVGALAVTVSRAATGC